MKTIARSRDYSTANPIFMIVGESESEVKVKVKVKDRHIKMKEDKIDEIRNYM